MFQAIMTDFLAVFIARFIDVLHSIKGLCSISFVSYSQAISTSVTI